ncbi:MAG: phage late control D family protein, partial [Wohlfahrtiimonas sp.]
FGKEDKTKMLRTTFRSEDEAMRAAEKEMQRLARGKESFNFFLAIGQPETLACSPVIVKGFKKDIDEKKWIANRVIHSLGDNGLTTQVETEVKIDEEEK